ncbi:hypothetical protein PG997_002719 [Apiospora hydei]|uniref:Uncharacterized protein n=1 Tax=Apiospora hydei TaxID=1337664 RepID=A0ABR1WX64_9PEZI
MEKVKSEIKTPYVTGVEQVDTGTKTKPPLIATTNTIRLLAVFSAATQDDDDYCTVASVSWYATMTSYPFAPLTASKQELLSNTVTKGLGKRTNSLHLVT